MKNLNIFKVLRFWRIALTVLVFLIFGSKDVLAIEYGGLGGRPAYPRAENPRSESIFVHTLEPGDVQDEGILVVNNTVEQKTVLVYGVDASSSADSSFACEQFSQEKNNVGAWLILEKSEVTLASGTSEIVPFVIAVPKFADVGEHNGCVVVQEKKSEKIEDGKSGVSLSFRTGLRVAITIPGELTRKLEIAGFTVTPRENGSFILRPEVKNLGNVSIDADIQVVTHYFFGLGLIQHGGQYPVFRGGIADWNFELKKPFWGGWYRSSLAVEYDENPEAGVGVESGKTRTRLAGPALWFWSFPKPAALIIEIAVFLLMVVGIALIWFERQRKRWIKTNWVSYEVTTNENINVIAERLDVSWQLLARINKITPPYVIKSGETIKIPPIKKHDST